MAVSYICGFELDSLAEGNQFNGTLSVQSTTTRSGGFALRINPTASSANTSFQSRAAAGTLRNLFQSVRFYIRIAALPNVQVVLAQCTASPFVTATGCAQLQLKATGELIIATQGVATATSTSQLTADGLWHRIDVDTAWNAGTGARVFVDGVQWASVSTGTPSPQATATLGYNSTATVDYCIDDVIWYDAALPATLTDYNVGLLLPVTQSAAGGWKAQDSTTTTMVNAIDNVPPAGTAATTAGLRDHITNGVSSTTDNYDAVCATYDSVVTAGGSVLAVQAICNDAQAITTGSPKAGAVVITANPTGQTENTFDFGIPNGTSGSTSAATMATFPTGWGTHVGPVTESPTITTSTGPTVRVGKRVAQNREVDVDFLGVYVMWQPPAAVPPVEYRQTMNQAVHRASFY